MCWRSIISTTLTSNAPTERILYSTTMSSSTITPAVRSSLEKYKDKYQKLKDTYAAKVMENISLKGELRKYQIEVRTLRWRLVKTASTLEGTLVAGGEKRANWDETDLFNNDIVKPFCKNKLLPNHKFLGPEQLKYMDDKRPSVSRFMLR